MRVKTKGPLDTVGNKLICSQITSPSFFCSFSSTMQLDFSIKKLHCQWRKYSFECNFKLFTILRIRQSRAWVKLKFAVSQEYLRPVTSHHGTFTVQSIFCNFHILTLILVLTVVYVRWKFCTWSMKWSPIVGGNAKKLCKRTKVSWINPSLLPKAALTKFFKGTQPDVF